MPVITLLLYSIAQIIEFLHYYILRILINFIVVRVGLILFFYGPCHFASCFFVSALRLFNFRYGVGRPSSLYCQHHPSLLSRSETGPLTARWVAMARVRIAGRAHLTLCCLSRDVAACLGPAALGTATAVTVTVRSVCVPACQRLRRLAPAAASEFLRLRPGPVFPPADRLATVRTGRVCRPGAAPGP